MGTIEKQKRYDNHLVNQSDGSIKAVIAQKPKNVEVLQRPVGSLILQLAKIDMSNYITRLIKVFHPKTRSNELREWMEKYGISEFHVYLGGTDTDSAKMPIVAVAERDTDLTADDYAYKIRYFICKYMEDILDLSDPYFKEYDLHKPQSKKELGLFSFDEINQISTVEPLNQLMFACYLGPKKYFELARTHQKMIHAGT